MANEKAVRLGKLKDLKTNLLKPIKAKGNKSIMIDPKEKAIQLVEAMAFSCIECDYEYKAKKCALIAVDELLFFFNNGAFILTYPEITKYEIPYWQEVKKEIEAL